MIQDSGLERMSPRPVVLGAPSLAGLRIAPPAVTTIQLRWGRRLVWIGRACLIVFAAVALISANREAGLLTLGALAQVSSAVRGEVRVGLVFLLLPLGTAFWLAGHWLARPARQQSEYWNLGPMPVVAPLSFLLLLTVVHLSPTIGWADVAFVLAGLGLLVLAYLFVLWDGPNGPALAGFIALVGGVQSLVGIGQFVTQHDLGLRWLGELPLSPSAVGISVLDGSTRVLRAYGLMRHPNALGAVLPLSLLAAISLWMRAAGRQRILWLALMVVTTAGLALSFSRAGWVAALAGVGVLLAASRTPRSPVRRPMDLSWALAVLVVAGVGFGIVSLEPGLFAGRVLGALGDGSRLEQGSMAERFFSLQAAWALIGRWPLWGVGTRQYVLAAAALIHVAPRESLLVDSTPLVLWAELGLAAPLAWLGMGLALVWLGCRQAAARAANPDLALATAWMAAIQVVGLFQAFYWPSYELWQGGIWLGVALGLWARAWSGSQTSNCHEHRVPSSFQLWSDGAR